MKTSLASTASPEGMILNLAFAQMTGFYEVPYMAGGICSDAKVPGIQAAYENMGTGMSAALSGCDLLVGVGILAVTANGIGNVSGKRSSQKGLNIHIP